MGADPDRSRSSLRLLVYGCLAVAAVCLTCAGGAVVWVLTHQDWLAEQLYSGSATYRIERRLVDRMAALGEGVLALDSLDELRGSPPGLEPLPDDAFRDEWGHRLVISVDHRTPESIHGVIVSAGEDHIRETGDDIVLTFRASMGDGEIVVEHTIEFSGGNTGWRAATPR